MNDLTISLTTIVVVTYCAFTLFLTYLLLFKKKSGFKTWYEWCEPND